MANFVRHESCPKCGSKDNLAIYDDGSFYCFSACGNISPSDDYKEELESKKKAKGKPRAKEVQSVSETTKTTKPRVTEEETQELKDRTSIKGSDYRGIKDATLAAFGVRTEYDETTGEVAAVYYPCTLDGELSGWKPRTHPKAFGGSIGITGKDCELFGQFKFKSGGKTCLIVGGEHDQLAAYQMLKDYYKSKNWEFDPVVVSPTIGETGSQKQLQGQYEFFAQFDRIIVGYDNDDAGRKATEKAVEVLPKGKVSVATWTLKDPNELLVKGKERTFISDFYNAKPFVPVGVVASNQISDDMRAEFKVPKIPLPPFMHKLQKMMAGGVPLGRIVNLGSASGTGKSTIIDEFIYDMIFHSPHLVGVVTLESTKGQYGIKLLSRHVGNKLELLDNDDALAILDSEEMKTKEWELFNNLDGTPRFYLVDDRDGEVEDIQGAIENLIVACNCKVIVLDPVSDVIASLENEEQENFMSWQKGMTKSHGVTFFNVCHTRKTASGQKAGSAGADLHEEDIIGSSSLYKSAACNLMFSRDKENEDEMVRNTTIMKATKIRWTGKTGIAGKYYYELEKHTLWDLDDYLALNGTKDF